VGLSIFGRGFIAGLSQIIKIFAGNQYPHLPPAINQVILHIVLEPSGEVFELARFCVVPMGMDI